MQDSDKRRILEELGGIPEEVYDSLVRDLVGQTADKLKEMHTAIAAGDWKGLVEMAHFIKGSAGNLRLTEIECAARTVETSAREQADAELIGENIKIIEEQIGSLSCGA